MKKNIIYSLLLVVAVLFAGCEDRLDIAKHGNMGGIGFIVPKAK